MSKKINIISPFGPKLAKIKLSKKFDPEKVYKGQPNPTKL